MPDLDSQTVILTLKRMNADVRIIAMSGLLDDEQLSSHTEVSAFLAKPFTARELLEKLQQLKA
jgi:two-component system, cell cycle sensor histidine kinase and response regulator CckA